MSDADRPIHVHVKDNGVEFDSATPIQAVSFHRLTSELSFGHFTNPPGDMGGPFTSSYLCFSMTLGNQSNTIWNTGEVHDDGTFIYLPHRPVYVRFNQPVESLVLMLDPAYLLRCVHETVDPDQIELLGPESVRDPLVRSVLSALDKECETSGHIDRLYCESLTTALCVHAFKNHLSLRARQADPTAGGLGKRSLHRVFDYIDGHLGEDLGLGEIADTVQLSPSHFTRLFKQSVGQTPHQYVTSRRVERAKALLVRGNLTVGEVAQVVGFYDQAHLIRHFKRCTGLTPGDFRK